MPQDFQPATRSAKPPVTQFKATAAQLPPGHPTRTAAIDRLVTRSFTAKGPQTGHIAKALANLNLSPDEVKYVAASSAARGNAAMQAKAKADWHDFTHTVLPKTAHVADLVATGGIVGDVSHGRVGSSAIDAATLLPILRPFKLARAGVEAGRAIKAADEGAKIVSGAKAARGSLEAGKGLVGPAIAKHTARTVRLGGVETQFPLSPSHVTGWAQRHLDRLSEGLVAPATKLAESDSAVARAAGKVVTKASARARVPIQAGKNLRQEARRAGTLRSEETHMLSPSVLHGDKGSQLAHFWWAQMPAELRNVDGLKLVRAKLAEERATLAEKVATASQKTEGVRNTPRLRAATEDLRSADANLSKIDKVIAKPPTYKPHAVAAARTLMEDHANALIAAGKLTPETAKERAGLISRWLGLKPTGEEVYIGHRLQEQPGGILPRGGGLGKTKLPEGVGKQNTLYRVKTGRVRQTLHTAVEDWQRGQAYHFTTTAKDELARMGDKIGPEGPKPDHLVVNPSGHKLPRTWKLDEHARAEAEGLAPEDVTVHDLGEYARNTIAEGADRARLIAAAQAAGHAEDLRQIPADVARRYFAQFVPHKVVAGTVPGVVGSMTAGRKAVDLAHDLVYASLIYSNPGYIPANTVANLVMAGMHQGAFLPVNIMRAGQAYFASGTKLRDLLSAEVGMGATKTAASGGRYPGSKIMDAATGLVAGVPDNVPRISAFLHEAARMGVISKVSPVLNSSDRAALIHLLTDPAARPLLNDIRDRSVQAMVDFERLGAHEKAVAKRLFFVWAWTRGATRYPARFMLDHPLRSAAGYALAGAPGAPEDVRAKVHEYTPTVAGGLPSWLQGALKAGNKTIAGHTYPAILPTGSISPASTPLQVYETAKNVVTGKGSGTVNNLANFVNPAIVAGVETAQGKNQFGSTVGTQGALESQALGLSPLANLIRGELHPRTGGLYPEDATRLGRLKRAFRILPVAVDPEQAYKSRVREGSVSQSEKDQHQRAADLQKIQTQLDALGPAVPPVWKKAATVAQQAATDRALAYAAAERKLAKGQKLAAHVRYEITLKVLRQRGMIPEDAYKAGLANSKGWTDRQYEHWRDYAWDHYGFGDAGGPGKVLSEVHRAHSKLPAVADVRTP